MCAQIISTNTLIRPISNPSVLPNKLSNHIRVVSYNITADFFDEKDPNHAWKCRVKAFFQLLKKVDADIYALQELSPNQAFQIYQELSSEYNALFLSQTPSDVDAGVIVHNEQVGEWRGKFMGTAIIGFLYRKTFKFSRARKFWFGEKPFELPVYRDRAETDKGFGNFNTYRAVFWIELIYTTGSGTDEPIYVFNSHYPLSGNNETRLKCAQMENSLIKQIAGENVWFSMGDRNLIPTGEVQPDQVYKHLVKNCFDVRDAQNHYGPSTTWAGFEYDQFKNPIGADGEFVNQNVLDILFSNRKAILSFHHPGHFEVDNAGNKILTDLDSKITSRNFASDHLMVGGDYLVE